MLFEIVPCYCPNNMEVLPITLMLFGIVPCYCPNNMEFLPITLVLLPKHHQLWSSIL